MRDGRVEAEYHACAYQVLELLDVYIDVSIDLRAMDTIGSLAPVSHITVNGVLPESIAQDFVMSDGENLLDILSRQGMEMNTQSTDGREDGWQIQVTGQGLEVFFDNDPSERFEPRPANPSRGTMPLGVPCP